MKMGGVLSPLISRRTPSGIVFKTKGLDDVYRCSEPAHLSPPPLQVSLSKLRALMKMGGVLSPLISRRTPSGIVFQTKGLDDVDRCSEPAHLSPPPLQVSFSKLRALMKMGGVLSPLISRRVAAMHPHGPQVSFLKLQPPGYDDSRCSL